MALEQSSSSIYTPSKIQLKKAIGYGESSSVYSGEVKDQTTGHREVAVKAIDLNRVPIESVRKEVAIQSNMRHENIVPILHTAVVVDAKEQDEELWVVMPLYKYSVSRMLNNRFPQGVKKFESIATILHDVLSALDYLHKQDIVHRDIKGGNILIGDDGKSRVADFGISAVLIRDMNARKTFRRTFAGSLAWMAPEVIESKPYGTGADIWSFGITALELAMGKAPRIEYPPLKIMLVALQEDPPTCPAKIGGTVERRQIA
jgi:serine/threonine protein kinase